MNISLFSSSSPRTTNNTAISTSQGISLTSNNRSSSSISSSVGTSSTLPPSSEKRFLDWILGELDSGRVPSLGEMWENTPISVLNLEPESPEMLLFQERLAGIMGGRSEVVDRRLQTYFVDFAHRQMKRMNNSLKQLISQLPPESPEMLAVQARIVAFTRIESTLEIQKVRAAEGDIYNGGAFSLSEFVDNISAVTLEEQREAEEKFYNWLDKTLDGGRMPSVKEMLVNTPYHISNLEPESTEMLSFQERVADISSERSALGDLRLQDYYISLAQSQLHQINGALLTISTGLEPGSQEAIAVQARIASLDMIDNALEAQELRIDMMDPFKGESFSLDELATGEYDNNVLGLYDEIPSRQQYLERLDEVLAEGTIPSLSELMGNPYVLKALVEQISPEDPFFQALFDRLSEMGSQGNLRSAQVSSLIGYTQATNIAGSLYAIAANLVPGSPEMNSVAAQIQQLTQSQANLAELFNRAYAQDEYKGRTVHSYKPEKPNPLQEAMMNLQSMLSGYLI